MGDVNKVKWNNRTLLELTRDDEVETLIASPLAVLLLQSSCKNIRALFAFEAVLACVLNDLRAVNQG